MFRKTNNDALKTMAIMTECGNFMADIFRVGKVVSDKLLPSRQYKLNNDYEENVTETKDSKHFHKNTDNVIQYQMLYSNHLVENQNQQFPFLNQCMYPRELFSELMTDFDQILNETHPEKSVQSNQEYSL